MQSELRALEINPLGLVGADAENVYFAQAARGINGCAFCGEYADLTHQVAAFRCLVELFECDLACMHIKKLMDILTFLKKNAPLRQSTMCHEGKEQVPDVFAFHVTPQVLLHSVDAIGNPGRGRSVADA
jgi:hypothetical protein